MKKAVSMILVIAVLLSCMTMTAFAGSTKISDALAQRIEQTSDSQRITVHVWLYSYVDKEAARRQATKECGYISGLPLNMTLDEVYAYKAAYNRIVSEQEAAVADSFVEKLGIAQEDIVYLGKHPYVIANLTKEQIESASTCPEVESIRCEPEEGTPTEPEDPPTEATWEITGRIDVYLYNDLVPRDGKLYCKIVSRITGKVYGDFDDFDDERLMTCLHIDTTESYYYYDCRDHFKVPSFFNADDCIYSIYDSDGNILYQNECSLGS